MNGLKSSSVAFFCIGAGGGTGAGGGVFSRGGVFGFSTGFGFSVGFGIIHGVKLGAATVILTREASHLLSSRTSRSANGD